MSTSLRLPDDQRTRAFRWLERVLRNDPTLASVVDDWYVWDDRERSDVELPPTTTSVRLTPFLEAMTPEASDGQGGVIYRCPVLVRIEARQFGQEIDAAVDLWGAIERALADRSGLAGAMREAGISWWEWVQPGAAAGDNVVSVGTLRLVCFARK